MAVEAGVRLEGVGGRAALRARRHRHLRQVAGEAAAAAAARPPVVATVPAHHFVRPAPAGEWEAGADALDLGTRPLRSSRGGGAARAQRATAAAAVPAPLAQRQQAGAAMVAAEALPLAAAAREASRSPTAAWASDGCGGGVPKQWHGIEIRSGHC